MPTENRSSNTEMVSVPERFEAPDMSVGHPDAGRTFATAFYKKRARADALAAILAHQTEQHQGEPVAYLCKAEGAKWLQYGSRVGDPWKPGEVQVTPLYTHAGPGEVERLKSTAEHFTGVSIKAAEEVSRLRAQLAERDALLKEVLIKTDKWMLPGLYERIRMSFKSASAEPSAPVAHA